MSSGGKNLKGAHALWMLTGALACVLLTLVSPVAAQDNYPASPVRMVVGFPPGGAVDVVARLLAQKLSAQMNANVFVENKPGAGGNIGAEFVVKSKPDGYTLLIHGAPVIFSIAMGEKVSYDLLKDLAPVALVASAPNIIVVHPSVAANTVGEFIAYVKANPDKLAYGSAGSGSFSHLAPLLFLQSNGLIALHVPYKGTAPASLDLVAGRTQFGMVDVASVLPLVKDKRVRALAVTSLKRLPLLPDVPALAETIPGSEIVNWYGIRVPANTPRAVVQKLNSEIVKALQDPDLISKLLDNGILTLGSTPEAYETYLKSELERWGKLIRSAGVKAE